MINQQQNKTEASLVAIALMVKNEASSIEDTLSTLSKEGIRDFFILDTGSSDDTVNLVEAFFKQKHLNGYVIQEPFIDFASSRNRTLQLAEQHFQNSTFILMPDAEWHLHNVSELLTFCEQEKQSETALYLLTIKMNGIEFSSARLFKTKHRIRFKGVVHEVPEVIAVVKVPATVYFEVNATPIGIEKSKVRWHQDLVLLLKEYQINPFDPRNTFYLAQTYECLGDLENAYHYYQYREKLLGWDEENFITYIRLGDLATKVKQTESVSGWVTAMNYYLKALSIRPNRVESYVKIAELYWPGDIKTCYFFIRQAYNIPNPTNDLLFIDKEAYDYTRYEILSRAAFCVGEYALGEEATLLALKVHPEAKHLQNNLKLYQQKLKSEMNLLSIGAS